MHPSIEMMLDLKKIIKILLIEIKFKSFKLRNKLPDY